MKAFRIITVILLLMAALFLISAWRIGLLVRPQFTEQQFGPYYMVYKQFNGHYQGIYQALDSLKAADWYPENPGASDLAFGFYLAMPDQVHPDSLRWLAGIMLTQQPDSIADPLITTAQIERQAALVGSIRKKSRAAALIGPFVVYPKLEDFARENGYRKSPFVLGEGIIELYQGEPGKSISYIMPVSKKSVN